MEMENGKRIDAKLCVMPAMNIFTTWRRELFYYFFGYIWSQMEMELLIWVQMEIPLCLIASQPTDSDIFTTFVIFLKSFKQYKFYYTLARTREAKMNLFDRAKK